MYPSKAGGQQENSDEHHALKVNSYFYTFNLYIDYPLTQPYKKLPKESRVRPREDIS